MIGPTMAWATPTVSSYGIEDPLMARRPSFKSKRICSIWSNSHDNPFNIVVPVDFGTHFESVDNILSVQGWKEHLVLVLKNMEPTPKCSHSDAVCWSTDPPDPTQVFTKGHICLWISQIGWLGCREVREVQWLNASQITLVPLASICWTNLEQRAALTRVEQTFDQSEQTFELFSLYIVSN